jgi:hypothetical protein
MKFRLARHTRDLQPIIAFYTLIPGMEVLGEFKDHAGYHGVFIGIKHATWHLEFTVSNELPIHQPDEDDLLVFYPDSIKDHDLIRKRFETHKIPSHDPKNPYWELNGSTYADPDGFLVVIARPADKEVIV